MDVSAMDANLEAARAAVRRETERTRAENAAADGMMHVYVTADMTTPEDLGRRIVTSLNIERDEQHDGACAKRGDARAIGVSMREVIGLKSLLAQDVLSAITFGGPCDDVRSAQRVALGSEALNSLAQLLGLRNGRVTALTLPPRMANAVQRLDRVFSEAEYAIFGPDADLGKAWQDRAWSGR